MIKQLNIFLLLPEANPLHTFFHNAYDFVEAEALYAFLKELEESVQWVYREKNAQSFYSLENVSRFLDNFEDFRDDYLFNPNSIMSDILTDAYNWQEEQKQEQNCSYFIWHEQKAHLVANHVLSEIAERKKNSPQESFLLFNFSAASFIGEHLTILKEIPEGNHLFLSTFPFVNNLSLFFKWLVENRQKRNFNLNPKHGENGVAAHKSNKGDKIDVLLCSRDDAQMLLDKAIGDQRQTTVLYNFDTRHQKFILFKFENETPQNQYHGYHLKNEGDISQYFKQLIEKSSQF